MAGTFTRQTGLEAICCVLKAGQDFLVGNLTQKGRPCPRSTPHPSRTSTFLQNCPHSSFLFYSLRGEQWSRANIPWLRASCQDLQFMIICSRQLMGPNELIFILYLNKYL